METPRGFDEKFPSRATCTATTHPNDIPPAALPCTAHSPLPTVTPAPTPVPYPYSPTCHHNPITSHRLHTLGTVTLGLRSTSVGCEYGEVAGCIMLEYSGAIPAELPPPRTQTRTPVATMQHQNIRSNRRTNATGPRNSATTRTFVLFAGARRPGARMRPGEHSFYSQQRDSQAHPRDPGKVAATRLSRAITRRRKPATPRRNCATRGVLRYCDRAESLQQCERRKNALIRTNAKAPSLAKSPRPTHPCYTATRGAVENVLFIDLTEDASMRTARTVGTATVIIK